MSVASPADIQQLHGVARRFLIVTADDFGLHAAVNAAVVQATQAGVLTAASLMVAAPATAEAIRLARELPQLRVGLHLVLTDGSVVATPTWWRPTLPEATRRSSSAPRSL